MPKPDTQNDAVAKLSQSNGSNFFASGLRQKVDQLMNAFGVLCVMVVLAPVVPIVALPEVTLAPVGAA